MSISSGVVTTVERMLMDLTIPVGAANRNPVVNLYRALEYHNDSRHEIRRNVLQTEAYPD